MPHGIETRVCPWQSEIYLEYKDVMSWSISHASNNTIYA